MHDYRRAECGAKLGRGFGEAPMQNLSVLECRLKTANVLSEDLPIQLIPNIKKFHDRN